MFYRKKEQKIKEIDKYTAKNSIILKFFIKQAEED